MKAALDIDHAAEYLDMTPAALRELIKREQIPYKQRGDKIILLVTELKAWLMALPGLTLHAAIAHLKDPAKFTAPSQTNPVSDSAIHPAPPAPITMRRGPRTHVSAASVPEQNR
jgi:hypothetical protein